MTTNENSELLTFLDSVRQVGSLELPHYDMKIERLAERAHDHGLIRKIDHEGRAVMIRLTGKGYEALRTSSGSLFPGHPSRKAGFGKAAFERKLLLGGRHRALSTALGVLEKRKPRLPLVYQFWPAICFIAVLCGTALSVLAVRV